MAEDPREEKLSLQQKSDMLREVQRMAKQRPDGVIPRNQWFGVYAAYGLRSRATQLAHQGDTKGAIDLYLQSIELDPFPSSPHYQIAKIHMDQNNSKAALPWIENTIKLQPTHYHAHNDAARIKTELGDVVGAQKHHQAVLDLAPSHQYNGASAARHRSRMALGKPQKRKTKNKDRKSKRSRSRNRSQDGTKDDRRRGKRSTSPAAR